MKVPTKQVAVFGKGAGRGIWALFKLSLFWIVIAFVLINSIIVGIQQEDISYIFTDLGEKILNPINDANQESIKILNNSLKGEGIFEILITYGNFFSAIYFIYLWIFVIRKVFFDPFMKDTNPYAIRLFLSIGLFFIIEIIYFLIVGLDLNLILTAFGNIGKVLVLFINKIASLFDGFLS